MKKRHLGKLLLPAFFCVMSGVLMAFVGSYCIQDPSIKGRIAFDICCLLIVLLGFFLCVYDPYSIVVFDDKMVLHNLLRPNEIIYFNHIKKITYPVVHEVGRRKETRLVLEINDGNSVIIRDYYFDFSNMYQFIQGKTHGNGECDTFKDDMISSFDIECEFKPSLSHFFTSYINCIVLLMIALLLYRIVLLSENDTIFVLLLFAWIMLICKGLTIVSFNKKELKISNAIYSGKRILKKKDISNMVFDRSFMRIYDKKGKRYSYFHMFTREQQREILEIIDKL